MPNPHLAESFLALFAGRTRAAAILGDLTEMAATRGRLWLAAAYLRTVVSLTWRIVLALFAAEFCREFIFDAFHIYLQHAPAAWRASSGPYLSLLNSSGPLLACIMSTLWFALPFAAVRYGVRDRFVQLTFAIALGTTAAFLCVPFASLLCAAVTVALACAALFSATWRKPLEVLGWTAAAGVLAIGAASAALTHPHAGSRLLTSYLPMLAFQSTLLIVPLVCSRLHRHLLDQPHPPA